MLKVLFIRDRSWICLDLQQLGRKILKGLIEKSVK